MLLLIAHQPLEQVASHIILERVAVNRCFFVECPCVQFQEMCKRLEFKSESERLADILKWAEGWQSENLIRPHTQMSRPNRSGPPDSLGTNNVPSTFSSVGGSNVSEA